MQSLPLVFSFDQPVYGNGFLALVRMNGRALLEECDGECWISGVAPVGLSGGGVDRSAAFTAFRTTWAEVLFDIVATAEDFDSFQAATAEFLGSRADTLTRAWEQALEEVRSSGYVDPSLPRRESPKHEIAFQVVEIRAERANPKANKVEIGLQTAA